MARVRLPGFVGPSYTSESRIAAYDRSVNLYAEPIESGTGQAPYTLYLAPGYTEFCELPTSPVRGFFTLNGVSWAVGGESLYQLPTTAGDDLTLLTAGLANPSDDWVTIAGNGDGGFQLMLSSGSFKYCFDLRTNTLTQIAGTANQVGFLDGYFLAIDAARSELSISALEDGTSWDAADVAQRNDAADKWVSMLVHQAGKEIWLFGTQSASVYYNNVDAASTGTAFPFVPNPSVFITYGIVAPDSADVLNGAPIWLTQGIDGGAEVRWAQGYTPVRVSTHATETAWAGYSTVSDARSFTYQERGHSFYVLTFPTANATWVFDATTGFWHERGLWNGWSYDALPVIGHIFANGMHLVGSPDSGVIYQQDKSILTTTTGIGQRWLRRAPHVAQMRQFLIIDAFELLMEVGLGLASGQGSDPMVSLAKSVDGGQTWSAPRSKSVGPVGAFTTRPIWRQFGRGDDWVFELTGSDPIPVRLLDAFLEVRVAR